MQTCRWEFLVFSGNFEMRLTVHEARQHGEVVFNLISSSFMRQFQGAWKVCAWLKPAASICFITA